MKSAVQLKLGDFCLDSGVHFRFKRSERSFGKKEIPTQGTGKPYWFLAKDLSPSSKGLPLFHDDSAVREDEMVTVHD